MVPRSAEQFRQMRENTRARILDAALELFATQGYHATTIDGIVARANVSKGLVYNHYRSTAELLEAIVVGTIQDMMGRFEDLLSKADTSVKLRDFIVSMAAMARTDFRFWRFYWSIVSQPSIPQRVQRKMMRALRNVISLFEPMFAKRGCDDPRAEAWLFAATLDGMMLYYALDRKHCPLDGIRDALLRRYGLRPPAGRSP
jgi:AcrR family transcriptional regulator